MLQAAVVFLFAAFAAIVAFLVGVLGVFKPKRSIVGRHQTTPKNEGPYDWKVRGS
jgi:hypothetical protein